MEHSSDCSGEYHGSMRPRVRQILGFLNPHKLFDTAHTLEKETQLFFDLAHVERMIVHGWWEEADNYVSGFVTANADVSAIKLLLHIRTLRILEKAAAGDKEWVEVYCLFTSPLFVALPNGRQIWRSLTLISSERAKHLLESELLRPKVVEIVKNFASKSPELKDKLQLCRSKPEPLEAVPLGVMKYQPRRRKRASRTPALDLARLLLQKRARSCQTTDRSGFPAPSQPIVLQMQSEPMDLLSAIFGDDILQVAGPSPEHASNGDLSDVKEVEDFARLSNYNFRRLLENPEKVCRLMYTSSGTSIVALTSNSVLKIWSWMDSVSGPPGRDKVVRIEQRSIPTNIKKTLCFAITTDRHSPIFDMDGKISLWDTLLCKVKGTFGETTSTVTCLVVYPKDENIIAAGFEDSSIVIYDKNAKTRNCLRAHEEKITGLAFSLYLNVLISSGVDYKLVKWNMDCWAESQSVRLQFSARERSEVYVQFHCNQMDFLVMHDSRLAVYNASTMQCLDKWLPRSSLLAHATYSCDGNLIYASFRDGRMAVLHAGEKKLGVRCFIDPTCYLGRDNSVGVYAVVIAAHPSRQNELSLGLSNGGGVVLEVVEKDVQEPPTLRQVAVL